MWRKFYKHPTECVSLHLFHCAEAEKNEQVFSVSESGVLVNWFFIRKNQPSAWNADFSLVIWLLNKQRSKKNVVYPWQIWPASPVLHQPSKRISPFASCRSGPNWLPDNAVYVVHSDSELMSAHQERLAPGEERCRRCQNKTLIWSGVIGEVY